MCLMKGTGPSFERWFSENFATGKLFPAFLSRGSQPPRPWGNPGTAEYCNNQHLLLMPRAWRWAKIHRGGREGSTRFTFILEFLRITAKRRRNNIKQSMHACKSTVPEHSIEQLLVFNKLCSQNLALQVFLNFKVFIFGYNIQPVFLLPLQLRESLVTSRKTWTKPNSDRGAFSRNIHLLGYLKHTKASLILVINVNIVQ